MSELQKIHPSTYLIPKIGSMLVPGLLIASEEQIHDPEIEKPLQQVRNVAHLPGIVGHSIAMPDIHWGYGFPIGGVAATDAETGVISPGGVGYDINCGVRLAMAPGQFKDLSPTLQQSLLQRIFQLIPSGVGKGHKERASLKESDYKKIASLGAKWSVEQGYGFDLDIKHAESEGFLAGADMDLVSSYAKERGRDQLGTIGSGNHFVEIGEVETIFFPEVAAKWGVALGQIYILIHSGSRGFGYQICQDTLDTFVSAGLGKDLPDKQLIYAPIKSPLGQNYFKAMASAANYAFNNRQQILHYVRQGFKEVLKTVPEEIRLIYDVCHNIAKFEEYEGKTLCVHRKGATRAFKEQPVLVPGDMGRASHLMIGLGNPITWCSSCHGAGRAKSRVKSMQTWKGRDPIHYMQSQGVSVLANSYRTIAEEMPDAYKAVDTVVNAVEEAGLAKKVVRLKPHLVIKG